MLQAKAIQAKRQMPKISAELRQNGLNPKQKEMAAKMVTKISKARKLSELNRTRRAVNTFVK